MSDIELTDGPAENFFAPDAPDGTPDPGPQTDAAPAAPEPQPVRLVIELGPNGISVGGPINDLVLCFGLLEMAKVSLLDHKRAAVMQQMQEQQEIQKVRQQMNAQSNKVGMRDFLRRK